MEIKKAIQDIVNRTKAYHCLDCGKCTSVCPISLLKEDYSPRRLVQKALLEKPETLLKDEFLWWCLTCSMCDEICESDVHYTEFIKDLRIEAHKIGQEGVYAHNGTMQSIMKMMTLSPTLKQNRLDWLTKDLKVKIFPSTSSTLQPLNSSTPQLTDSTDLIYFVGCLPYFDKFFTNLELNTLNIAKSTIKILNHLGIEPILMANEKCCGHDLLWTGDIENFKKLAQQNIEEIKRTGAKKIVFSCAEGYQTFKQEYPKYIGALDIEVIHISELIAENLPELKFQEPTTDNRTPITYQDPCRLGRFCGIYEEPRQIMNAMELKLNEMPKNRKSAICCGTSGWMNCGTYSKQIQVARLTEAKNTGADLLITSCPKCQIHFKCAMNDENTPKEAKIEIQDLTTLIANQLKER